MFALKGSRLVKGRTNLTCPSSTFTGMTRKPPGPKQTLRLNKGGSNMNSLKPFEQGGSPHPGMRAMDEIQRGHEGRHKGRHEGRHEGAMGET